MPGKSDFPIKINRQAIAEITANADHLNYNAALVSMYADGCPAADIDVARTLLGLVMFLSAHRCEPDFELVLGE